MTSDTQTLMYEEATHTYYTQTLMYEATHKYDTQSMTYEATHTYYTQTLMYEATHTYYTQTLTYEATYTIKYEDTYTQQEGGIHICDNICVPISTPMCAIVGRGHTYI